MTETIIVRRVVLADLGDALERLIERRSALNPDQFDACVKEIAAVLKKGSIEITPDSIRKVRSAMCLQHSIIMADEHLTDRAEEQINLAFALLQL